MAQFDESKVINALHPEKAEVGKRYWYSDNLKSLKKRVEENVSEYVGKLESIEETENLCFLIENKCVWALLYPYEEPPKQRMTYRQLAEWLAKGNGEYTDSDSIEKYCIPMSTISYSEERRDEPVYQGLSIRTWDSEEWVEPTVDIYERDCKKE